MKAAVNITIAVFVLLLSTNADNYAQLRGRPLFLERAGRSSHHPIGVGITWGAGLIVAGLLVASVQRFIFHLTYLHQSSWMPLDSHLRPSTTRLLLYVLMTPISAAITEELIFRVGIMTILCWLLSGGLIGFEFRPTRACRLEAILLQGYIFGLAHISLSLIRTLAVTGSGIALLLLRPLILPQMWIGIGLALIYLRNGIEVAIVAHALIDTIALTLAAMIVTL